MNVFHVMKHEGAVAFFSWHSISIIFIHRSYLLYKCKNVGQNLQRVFVCVSFFLFQTFSQIDPCSMEKRRIFDYLFHRKCAN